jgi:UDP-glucose 4-epimerase
LVATPKAAGNVVNLGSQQEVTMNDLAELVRSKINPECEIRHIPYEQAYRPGFEDMQRRVPCLDRARSLIEYAPRRKLDEILDDMIAYAKSSQRPPLRNA